MSMNAIEESLAQGLAPVYLVMGDEELLVDRGAKRVTEAALEGVMAAFNLGSWRAGADGAIEALSIARTLPMMSARRVVVLRELEEAPADLLERLAEYCESPVDSTVLILVGQKWPKASGGSDHGRRAEARIKKSGQVFRFKSKDQDPVAFAVEAARELGCRLQRSSAELLVAMVGKDLGQLQRELEKAALYVGGSGELSEEVLGEVCSMLADAQVWDLTDAVVARDADRALGTAHRILESGNTGEERKLLALISWQLRQLLVLQQVMRTGEGGAAVKMPGWKRRAAENALRRSPLNTAHVLEQLAQANLNMNSHKAGSRRIFEGLLLQLVSRSA